ncbi:MAG: hypothetical protein A2297_08165 [Elusimicrobia bacterium RIFOXYB2_FULL_48_7]|nr:MAG: hypothetical protein A2297_08165 [Elusimicrobia bacterium RIFOXYB2_FULL_48_7]
MFGNSPLTIPPKTHLLTIPGITILILSFSFLFNQRKSRILYILAADIFITAIMLCNLWYYRYFSAPISFFSSSQFKDFLDVLDGFYRSLRVTDFFYFIIDFLIFPFLLRKKTVDAGRNLRLFAVFFIAGMLLFSVKAIKRAVFRETFVEFFDPINNIVALTPVGYQVFDFFEYFLHNKKITLNEGQVEFIKDEFKKNAQRLSNGTPEPASAFKGSGKGMNLLIIQVESLDAAVINRTFNGLEITPCLNKFVKESMYFPNFYSQIAIGTSDAEFVINTSMYPLPKGSVTYRYPLNKYISLPFLLKKHGYKTMVMHANRGSYWNRHLFLPALGFEKFYTNKEYTPGEMIGMGLNDNDFLGQSLEFLKDSGKPFYAHIITLSSHFPYDILPDKYKKIQTRKEGATLGTSIFTDYLNCIHYTDKCLGRFLSALKSGGLLNKTVVVIVGDHDALSNGEYVVEIQKKHPLWQVNRYRNAAMVIRVPGRPAGINEIYSGQVDILPTVSYIMGIDREEYAGSSFGKNVFTSDRNFTLLPAGGGAVMTENQQYRDSRPEIIKALNASELIIKGNYFAVQ